MRNSFKKIISVLILSIIIFSCKKTEKIEVPQVTLQKKQLNDPEVAALSKMELATDALSVLFKDKGLRKEFHNFISAKLKKTGYSEELTFRELFSESKVQLPGVNPDFLMTIRYLELSNTKGSIMWRPIVYQ
ncbi:MAG: hypothetical protein K2W79_02680, partial [Hydrotalea flava]|nr:hypothetical protein [Hydrotalea flava]